MKTSNLTQFLLGSTATIVLAALLIVPAPNVAAGTLKGAELLRGASPAPVPVLTVAVAVPASHQACAACTNLTKPFATEAGRGAFVKTGVTVTHLCPSCQTTIATVGSGRAKVDQAVHTCANGTLPSCCSGMAGM